MILEGAVDAHILSMSFPQRVLTATWSGVKGLVARRLDQRESAGRQGAKRPHQLRTQTFITLGKEKEESNHAPASDADEVVRVR